MPTVVLSPDEIMLLSALAPQKPSFLYPLQHLLEDENISSKQEETREIFNNFLENGLIWKTKEDYPMLNVELAVAFSILNHPEDAVHIRAFSRPETPAYVLCGRKGRWVILTMGKDDSFFAVNYLFKYKDCAQWFSFDLLGKEEFKEPYFKDRKIEVTSFELGLLSVIQGIFRARVDAKKGTLDQEEQLIVWEDLRSKEEAAKAQKVLPYELEMEKFGALFEDISKVKNAADSMAEKEILQVGQEGVTFTDLAKRIFDPGKLKNMFVFSKPGLIDQHKTLQVYSDGYLILSPVMSKESKVSIRLLPGSISGEKIFDELMTWEPLLLPEAELEEESGKEDTAAKAGEGSFAMKETPIAAKTAAEAEAAAETDVVNEVEEPQWFLSRQGEQYGPYSWLQLQSFARERILTEEDLVWNAGMEDWTRAENLTNLFG